MTFRILTLSLCSLLLISCGDDKAGPKALSTNIEKRGKQSLRLDGTQGGESTKIQAGTTWGRVYLDESIQSGQDAFQQQVNLLLEPQFKADEVGVVNGIDDSALPDDQKKNTGIAFWGKGITLSAGFDPNKTDYPESVRPFDADKASLRISIYRSITKAGATQSVIEEIPIHFNDGEPNSDTGKLVDSYIEGNQVQLIFADAFGKINVWGTFDKDNFVGRIFFKTDKTDLVEGQDPVAVDREVQVLGKFSVSTCGFFTCAN